MLATSQKYELIGDCIFYDRSSKPGDDNVTFICSDEQYDEPIFQPTIVQCNDHDQGFRYLWPGTIEFQDCRFTEMPPYNFFKMFYNMHTFIISNVDLQRISANTFKEAANVTNLIATQNHLEEIPAYVFISAHKLRNLDFSRNAIRRIDASAFVGLSNLRYLHLSHNALTKVDENFFKEVPNLHFLNLSYNHVNEFESDALDLPTLLELDLANNDLTKLDDHLFDQLNNLKQLNLSSNPIGNLKSETFEFLVNLEHLRLRRMNISRIELGTFSKQQKLISLDMAENFLIVINFNVFVPNLPGLRMLNLTSNQLSELKGFRSTLFPHLITLDIQRNKFNCSYLENFMKSVHWENSRKVVLYEQNKCFNGNKNKE